ncbi:valine--tRNA ligase [Stakelama pacifica]|uniref:Valine--tRNA ligase n=1 Tax=Stakelama pacifica TaxID=517720 RepID=A0A4R6FWZ3_9SPHN|nr:valine--tRNA ligase [Stakelama pacifica]TDN86486.1 valyl-tRNA synthetase [Stakelama pacifica]GGO89792.1 valine--tRNA ligase [Stakelama pacifica]
MSELPKTFDPAAIEQRWYEHWEDKGLFRPDRPGAEPWTIVNPPPNVTGSLHIGHALDNTLQDILVRHARLQGKDARWVVGTDHAGIATQMVVERQLNAQGEKRTDYDRDAFVDKVWEWKAESGGQITRQLRRLGCSMDWANERFTMDEGFSKAVIKVFVDLHEQGLIYRDKRLVNWDPGLGTAISDLEVETREVQGKFWHLAYPLADGSGHIRVATTRPETMLADMAVAVHPDDDRYKALIGKMVKLPITGREIPIIADEHADPELGSGAVKITPGHDFNDFEVGRRYGFKAAEMYNMLDAKARVVQTADGLIPDAFIGLSREDARAAVVEALKAAGALIPHVDKDGAEHDAEPRTIQTPYGDRSGVVIEPWLTDQWYVDAETLAGPAIEAVRSGAVEIVPKAWEKTYFNWMENIQPWCVSRQLWWGHRIPAWYAEDGSIFVAETEEAAQAKAGEGVSLRRDEDVLDTWFSSALWPFATMGWPDEDVRAAGRYPNDILISGFDILFFWDARMLMQGMHFLNEVPFRKLYLHGLVRAADGSKMSKSKGNTIDPLGLIDQYGADALRFFMAAMESQGRDIKMDQGRVEGYRNFATKLWNAARFCQANGIGGSDTIEAPEANLSVNRWIIAETIKTVQQLDLAFADLRFDGAANTVYHFVWDRFCDWYLELIKPILQGERGLDSAETRKVAGWVLDQILVMLHPFMPFITEELWHALGPREHDLIVARWPIADARALYPEAMKEMDWLIRFISELRRTRSELNVPPGARTHLWIEAEVADREAQAAPPVTDVEGRILANAVYINRLARVDWVEFLRSGLVFDTATGERLERQGVTHEAQGCATFVVDDQTYMLPLADVIDFDVERTRLTKTVAAIEKERDALAKRLENPAFVEKAKPEAVEKARSDHAEKAAEAERLREALERLG